MDHEEKQSSLQGPGRARGSDEEGPVVRLQDDALDRAIVHAQVHASAMLMLSAPDDGVDK